MVLTKGVDERGFAFFTNYASRKGGELEANPHAALLFHWPQLGRQVRVEGAVDATRARRERGATRAAARATAGSARSPRRRAGRCPSREWLEQRVAELDAEHEDPPVSGDDWGGYRLAPEAWEFWQHRPNRLHDRFRYEPEPPTAGWRIERLGPLAVRERLDRQRRGRARACRARRRRRRRTTSRRRRRAARARPPAACRRSSSSTVLCSRAVGVGVDPRRRASCAAARPPCRAPSRPARQHELAALGPPRRTSIAAARPAEHVPLAAERQHAVGDPRASSPARA